MSLLWGSGQVSELDLDQKLEMRRAFWALGSSTRIDVKLSALVSGPKGRTRITPEEWTDLDVLGVQYVPTGGLVYSVADCKTTKGRATERVFWLRGVSDLFGARAAYMTKDSDLPASTRQLARRLDISSMDRRDRTEFVSQAGELSLPATGRFFEVATLRNWDQLISAAPRGTARLQRYRRAVYWVMPKHRNLIQLPAYLAEANRHFLVSQLWAQALLVDLAWLYLLTTLNALDEVTRLHLGDSSGALRQVIVGGEPEMREKEALRDRIRDLLEFAEPDVSKRPLEQDIVPAYFSDLSDLIARAMRRRTYATEALRVLEFTGTETIAGRGASWAAAFPAADPLAPKLASDVVRFLCRAAKLDVRFVDAFDAAVAGVGDLGHRAQDAPLPRSRLDLFDSADDA